MFVVAESYLSNRCVAASVVKLYRHECTASIIQDRRDTHSGSTNRIFIIYADETPAAPECPRRKVIEANQQVYPQLQTLNNLTASVW
jgi:hypothetical protein